MEVNIKSTIMLRNRNQKKKKEPLHIIDGGVATAFLKQLKAELPYDPAIVLLGISKKNETTLLKSSTSVLMFVAALLVIAKEWKQ